MGGVPGFLGRVLDGEGRPVGTCFQVAPRIVVTARHVLLDAGVPAGAMVGADVAVDGLAPGTAPSRAARVIAADQHSDLAVLERAEPLPGTVTSLVASEAVPLTTDVSVTGHVVLEGTAALRHACATGRWSGTAMRDDATALARMSCQDLSLGMSGAPVLRLSDGAVVAVVSARYNPPDSWSRDTVWLARTEDLATLIADHASLVLAEQVTLTAPVDLTLTVDAGSVHLFGGGVDVRGPHQGVSHGLAGALDDVRRARARAGTTRADTVPELRDATTSMRRVGELMAASFLPDPVRNGLAGVMRRAEAASQAVRIGVRIDPARVPVRAVAVGGIA